jgi:hypothetical protein
MPCNLKPDPKFAYDFLAKAGSSSILYVENDSSNAVIESADFNNKDTPVSADGKITITEKVGLNILTITINGAEVGDNVRLKEDCGGGTTELKAQFVFDNDPVKRYQINAAQE